MLYYLITVSVWGTTWLAIKFQLGSVSPSLSIAYRFLLASAMLFLFCRVRGVDLKLTRGQHLQVLALGATSFCFNYLGTYYSEVYLASGVVAVLFATVPLWNILNSQMILGQRPQPRVVLGALIGLLGVLILFRGEVLGLNADQATAKGLGLGVAAAFIASIGNVVFARVNQAGIRILPANAFGMLYGGLITLGIGMVQNTGPAFEFSWSYGLSLLYLGLFGSVVAFGAYFSLIRKLGPTRASYVAVATPIVALVVSTFLEKFHWNFSTVLGVLVILGGNIFVMIMRQRAPAESPEPAKKSMAHRALAGVHAIIQK